MAKPSPENGRPAATPPPPAANLQPRTARSALILAGFLATVVAGWYVWGDAISDKLAGVGHGGGHRETKETAVVLRSATLNRSALPSPPSDTQRQRAEDAAPPVEAQSQPAALPNQDFTLYFTSGSAEQKPPGGHPRRRRRAGVIQQGVALNSRAASSE